MIQTQEEMDETFIATLESIIRVCDKTTSGNVSHNIATIKGKCNAMLQFYKEFPVNSWHSVADGDLPKNEQGDYLFAYGNGFIDKGFFLNENTIHLDGEFTPMLDIEDVKFWMEIPAIPEKEK